MTSAEKFRTGLIGLPSYSTLRPDLLLHASRRIAAACRADSIWIPDHLINLIPASIWQPKYIGAARIAPSADALYDAWMTLTYHASKAPRSKLRLGIGVTDTGRHHPAVTAQAAATLHLLGRGRAVLGIGPGERENNEPYGVDWNRPVARFEEALATIRALWDSKGEPIYRDSEFFPLRAAVFGLPPYEGTRPPIWVAAHGPRMLRATGRYADAWFPAFTQRPEDYKERLTLVRSAASDAGRDPQSITPAGVFFIFPGQTRAAVDELMASVPARLFALGVPAKIWADHGADHPLGSTFTGFQDLMPQHIDEDTALSFADRVPESLLQQEFLNGTPNEIADQLAHWRDNGLRYAVLADMSVFHSKLLHSARGALPFVTLMRKIRKL
ncbi:LLM class flavin-dependent oxidoreductase [Nocardia sp. CA-107356]|uniref:LLM class flavin-dependent oxidoreductase n=1 Tax=Nocardia sp. CA-107356 TaxID=3239972 RepID=UPI003D8A0C34